MTNPKKPKKFLSLDDVRIYPNRDNNTFSLIASTDEIPGGFMLTLPAGAMEAKVREYFQNSGVSEPQQTDDSKLPDAAYLTYGEKVIPAEDASKRKAQHILSDSALLYEPTMGNVIAITSARGGAGKTATSILLGATFAAATNDAGRPLKTIIVDCDISDPGLTDVFAHDDLAYAATPGSDIPAVPDMLDEKNELLEMSDIDFLAHVVYSDSLGIHALFNRKIPVGNTSRAHESYRKIIERLKKHFDIIILDTGSYATHSLPSEIAFPLADKIILVTPTSHGATAINKWFEVTQTFPILKLPAIDYNKVRIVSVSPFATNDAFVSRSKVHGFSEFTSVLYPGLKFIGVIPLDTQAVENAYNSGQMGDLLKYHPYFGEAYQEIARNLFDAGEESLTFEESVDDDTPVVQADDDCVLVGVRPNGKPLAIDFISGPAENGVSQGIFITHDEENAPSALIENLLGFVKNKRPDKEVITCGLPSGIVSGNTVKSNLELLSILRSLAVDAREGKDISDKVLFFGDSFPKSHNDTQDWVDKAVLSEIHGLIGRELRGKMQVVMVASKPKSSMTVMATNSPDYVCIHFGSKRRVRSTDEFLRKAFDKDVVGLSAYWPKNRAYVKAPNYEGLIQVFEVKK